MKTLLLVRHAKSSWSQPNLTDFDRPLNERGKREAPEIATILREMDTAFEMCLLSPAQRTRETASAFLPQLPWNPQVHHDEKLYLADVHQLMSIIGKQSDTISSLCLVGHNPGLTELANYLTEAFIDNIPTSGVVRIGLHGQSWKEACRGTGSLLEFKRPLVH